MGLLTKSVQDGLTRTITRTSGHRRFSSQMNTAFNAASMDRLTQDWARALLSPDQEDRISLRVLRSRSRHLAMNNEHAIRFLRASGEQVIGENGVALEMTFTEDQFSGADKFNRTLEKAWERYCKCVTADGKFSMPESARLWLVTVLTDGETFVNKIKGYPYNDSSFALQLVDADQVDINLQRLRRPNDPGAPNEIRMGIELDEWRRIVAYHIYEGHPSEFVGIVRKVIPAAQMDHAGIFRRYNETRCVPWMAPAMLKLHMVGEYDFAEVTAARWAACKLGYLVTKLGEEGYTGGEDEDKDGDLEINVEPGTVEQLPIGVEPKVIDWQHPNGNYETFTLAALRGVSSGLNIAYENLTNDRRSVNFSSIRQGILSERDGWAVLQAFTVNKFYRPTFEAWLPMAILTRQIELPRGMQVQDVCEAALWTPRGWDWVDPNKDVQASIAAIRSGLSTYQKECAKRGLDWRKVFKQRAEENKEAEKLGLALDLTTSGAGGVEGDTSSEDPERAAEPTKPNGKGALSAIRLPQ